MSRLFTSHPVTAALYFTSVLLVTMFSQNPVLLLIALSGAVTCCLVLEPARAFFKSLTFYLPLFLVVALTNPLFTHNGETPLFFLNGNPITKEALIYGVVLAVMLVAAMLWFRAVQVVMTDDKVLALLGRLSPKLALLLCGTLRFVPLLKRQAAKIRQTQETLGLFSSEVWTDKLRATLRVYSALISWALEAAIDTGAAMKARGYGLPARTQFTLFRFTKTDGVLCVLIAVLDAVVLISQAWGVLDFACYPRVSAVALNAQTLPAVAAFALLSFLPLILHAKEVLAWRCYRSTI